MDKDLDRKIVIALGKDGRRSNTRLAGDLGVSVATVAKRLNHLVQQGSVVFRAVPDPDKTGYRISAVVAMEVDLTEVSGICDEFIDDVRATMIATTFGRFNLFFLMHFTDWDMLNDFLVNKVRLFKSVHQIEIFFITELTKRYHRFFDGNN